MTHPPPVIVREFRPADEESWLRCRVLSFLHSQYYDDVRTQRPPLDPPGVGLVAVAAGDTPTVIGVLDIEIDGAAATIDTIAVHPDHQRRGIADQLLRTALPKLSALGARTLDAWTREDAPANAWYRRTGFVEQFRYLHVYLADGEDDAGFTTPEGLSGPVSAFVHARIEQEAELRKRHRRVYVCRQYLRPVAGPTTTATSAGGVEGGDGPDDDDGRRA